MRGVGPGKRLCPPHLLHIAAVALPVSLPAQRAPAPEVAVAVRRPVTWVLWSKLHASSWHAPIVRHPRALDLTVLDCCASWSGRSTPSSWICCSATPEVV